MSYLNLDWKPVAVLSKFVDIVVNGMTDKGYEIKSFASDPYALKERTDYAFNALRDITNKDLIQEFNDITGKNFFKTPSPNTCLLYTSPSPRDRTRSRMPSSA